MEWKKPYLAAIVIQLIYAGMFLLSKAAFDVGMNTFVFVFYRQAAATLFLLPLAFFFEWKNAPPLLFATFLKVFMISLCGITLSLNLYGVALIYTSASLAAATTNCLPVITFFLALLLRMESVKVRTAGGMAKVTGIAICISGALVIAFYKGPSLKLLPHHHSLFGFAAAAAAAAAPTSTRTDWVKGCFLMLAGNTFWGLWLVFQARVMKRYPAKLVLTTLQCLLSTIQSFFIAIAVERHPNQWKLQWNVGLLSVVYCGIVVTGITYYLQAWVIEKKGPVFIAMSTPLALLFTMFSSTLLLGEIISLGSVLGGMLLVGGLYSVLWGKSRELHLDDHDNEDDDDDDDQVKQQQLQVAATEDDHIDHAQQLEAAEKGCGRSATRPSSMPP